MEKRHNSYAVQFRTKKQGRKPAGEWKTQCWIPMYVIDGEDGKPYTFGHKIHLGWLLAREKVAEIEWSSTLEARAIPAHSCHFDDTQGDRIEFQAFYDHEIAEDEDAA